MTEGYGKYSGAGFVEISWPFAMQDAGFCFERDVIWHGIYMTPPLSLSPLNCAASTTNNAVARRLDECSDRTDRHRPKSVNSWSTSVKCIMFSASCSRCLLVHIGCGFRTGARHHQVFQGCARQFFRQGARFWSSTNDKAHDAARPIHWPKLVLFGDSITEVSKQIYSISSACWCDVQLNSFVLRTFS